MGILGSILGIQGYQEKGTQPKYYKELNKINVGISPLNHEKGSFKQIVIKYNNGVGYASKEEGGILNLEEATLIKPSYRVYLLLNLENENEEKLYEYLQNGFSEYIPYFGKNEHYAWWERESFCEYEYEQHEDLNRTIRVKTIFVKEDIVKEHKAKNAIAMIPSYDVKEDLFMYFERIPKDFNLDSHQYNICDYVFTTFKLKNSIGIGNTLYYLKKELFYVQLL